MTSVRHLRFLPPGLVLVALFLFYPLKAVAVTCTSQAELPAADRTALTSASAQLATLVFRNDANSLRSATLGAVQAQFDAIYGGIQQVAPLVTQASYTIQNLYLLDASDLKAAEDAQFFCGNANSTLTVVFNFNGLPPGKYAVAILTTSGGKASQQMTFVLGQEAGAWKLAGFYAHPAEMAGNDGLWYWKKAREYARKQQLWNAYFYYETARFLLTPVEFLSSPNLEKLDKELASVTPSGLPIQKKMTLTQSGRSWQITGFRTDGSLGGFDLVVTYEPSDPGTSGDPVAARSECVTLMKDLLAQHPEFRDGFHGFWIHAESSSRAPYAIELPMSQIE